MRRSSRLEAIAIGLLSTVLPTIALAQVGGAAEPGEVVTTLATMIRGTGIAASIIVILSAWLLLRFLTQLVDKLGIAFAEYRLLIQKIAAFVRFGVYFATILLTILLSFEISRDVLAILGGTAAVAIGFATKDLVSSLVAGLMIMFDRPFQVGDRVEFGGEYGDIVREAGVTSRYVHLPKPVVVRVKQVVEGNYLALRIRLKAYVLDTQYEKPLETDVTLRVMEDLREAQIQPPAVLHRNLDDVQAAPLRAVGASA